MASVAGQRVQLATAAGARSAEQTAATARTCTASWCAATAVASRDFASRSTLLAATQAREQTAQARAAAGVATGGYGNLNFLSNSNAASYWNFLGHLNWNHNGYGLLGDGWNALVGGDLVLFGLGLRNHDAVSYLLGLLLLNHAGHVHGANLIFHLGSVNSYGASLLDRRANVNGVGVLLRYLAATGHGVRNFFGYTVRNPNATGNGAGCRSATAVATTAAATATAVASRATASAASRSTTGAATTTTASGTAAEQATAEQATTGTSRTAAAGGDFVGLAFPATVVTGDGTGQGFGVSLVNHASASLLNLRNFHLGVGLFDFLGVRNADLDGLLDSFSDRDANGVGHVFDLLSWHHHGVRALLRLGLGNASVSGHVDRASLWLALGRDNGLHFGDHLVFVNDAGFVGRAATGVATATWRRNGSCTATINRGRHLAAATRRICLNDGRTNGEARSHQRTNQTLGHLKEPPKKRIQRSFEPMLLAPTTRQNKALHRSATINRDEEIGRTPSVTRSLVAIGETDRTVHGSKTNSQITVP